MATLATLADNSIDLVCTDPPYKVISGGKNTKHKAGWKVSVLKENDGKIFKHNAIKTEDWMAELYRVLKPGREAYIMVNNLLLLEYLTIAKQVGFKFHNLLRWDKNTKNANRWYMKDCEYTLFFYKPPARTINNPGSAQGFKANNPRNKAKTHPTEKPVSLFRHYIENSTEPGWVVLDPFMGYGAAAIACLRLGRQFIGIELDQLYFKRAERRVNKWMSKHL
jgi:site-specific DNA-methyltransferase (adenine-specific)